MNTRDSFDQDLKKQIDAIEKTVGVQQPSFINALSRLLDKGDVKTIWVRVHMAAVSMDAEFVSVLWQWEQFVKDYGGEEAVSLRLLKLRNPPWKRLMRRFLRF